MGSCRIVVDAPVSDDLSGMTVIAEQMFVQAFIAQASVEAFDEAVLHGLARLDVMPLDTSILAPLQNGIGCQLRSIVADHHAGKSSRFGDPVQFPPDADAGNRVIDHRRQTFPAEVINDTQNAEAPAIDQGVRDEVQRPTLVRPLGERHGRTSAERPFPPATLADRQAFLLVQPVQLLPVHLDTLALEQNV